MTQPRVECEARHPGDQEDIDVTTLKGLQNLAARGTHAERLPRTQNRVSKLRSDQASLLHEEE